MPLHDQLTTLESTGLIRLIQSEPDLEYLFRHALVQEAVYASMLKADRKQLHARVGAILASVYAGRPDEVDAVLAYHYAQAEESAKTLRHAHRAASQFKHLYANAEALTYYDLALQSAEALQRSANEADRRELIQERFEILSERQGVWSLIGSFDRTRSDLEQMIDLARTLNDDTRLADALNGIGYFMINTGSGDPRPALEEALTIKRRVGDRAGQADSLNSLASALLSMGLAQKAMACFWEARGIYEALGNEDGIARSEWSLGLAEYELLGQYESAHRHFERSLELSRKLGLRGLECGGLMMIGASHIRMGDFDSGDAALQAALDRSQQIGDQPTQAWIALYQSWICREKNQFAEAVDLLNHALTVSRERGMINLTWYSLFTLGQCQLQSGDLQRALENTLTIYRISRDISVWADVRARTSALLAAIYAEMKMYTEAKTHADETLREMEALGQDSVSEVAGVYLYCYQALRATESERARDALKTSRELLLKQAGAISLADRRERFLNNVSVHRDILEACLKEWPQ
jgi:tetratricopeptide (TPR) repeat protein